MNEETVSGVIHGEEEETMEAEEDRNPESVVRKIKRRARRKYSAEEKIGIILEGLKGLQ